MLRTFIPEKHLIIRTTWVFGQEARGKNFVYSVVKNLSLGKEMKVPSDISATPTYVKDLAKCILDLIEKGYWGIFNITGGQCMSRMEFAKNIAIVFDLNSSLIKEVKQEMMQLPANRPLRTGLKIEKIKKAINPNLTSLMDALKETRLEIEKAGQLTHAVK